MFKPIFFISFTVIALLISACVAPAPSSNAVIISQPPATPTAPPTPQPVDPVRLTVQVCADVDVDGKCLSPVDRFITLPLVVYRAPQQYVGGTASVIDTVTIIDTTIPSGTSPNLYTMVPHDQFLLDGTTPYCPSGIISQPINGDHPLNQYLAVPPCTP